MTVNKYNVTVSYNQPRTENITVYASSVDSINEIVGCIFAANHTDNSVITNIAVMAVTPTTVATADDNS